jgi:membrane protein YdbS with pleckstrin-like domain
MTIVALLILAGGILLGWLLSLDADIGTKGFRITFLVIAIIDAVWYVPAMIVMAPYYRSLSYEVQDDEVIVRAGIWTKSVKHVPYRTVTNLTIKRGVLDRLFGLGTLNIQTAGMSGQTGAEENLVGLANVQGVYELVVTELRRFRGGMAPTAAEVEGEPIALPSDALNKILAEVRAIRQALETE